MNNKELYHYGVLGMKWGRKNSKVHSDHASAHSRKRISSMSNQELRDRNNRLQMEKQYRDLKRSANKGRQAVSTFIKTAGTIAAVSAAYATYKKFGTNALNRIGNAVMSSISLKGPWV